MMLTLETVERLYARLGERIAALPADLEHVDRLLSLTWRRMRVGQCMHALEASIEDHPEVPAEDWKVESWTPREEAP